MPSERHRRMGVGLASDKNKRKSAPRGTFTLHKNSVDEDAPVVSFQEYPKHIGDDLPLALNEAHEAQIRAGLEKPKKKGDKDAA